MLVNKNQTRYDFILTIISITCYLNYFIFYETACIKNHAKYIFLVICILMYPGVSMGNSRYIAKFKTQSSYCFLIVNDVHVLNTMNSSKGTISTAADITPMLENGENKIGFIFRPDDWGVNVSEYYCEIELVKTNTNNNAYEPIVGFRVTFSGGDKLSFDDKTTYSINLNKESSLYSISERTIQDMILLDNGVRANAYGYTTNVNISNIPQWAWTKASTQKIDNSLRAAIIKSYSDIIDNISHNEINKIKEKYAIAIKEGAVSTGMDEGIYFETIGINDAMVKGHILKNPDWNKFKLVGYANNRIFRLERYPTNKISPIEWEGTDDFYYSWCPYFSIIDGKLVLVR